MHGRLLEKPVRAAAPGPPVGRFFAASKAKLQVIASMLNVRHLVNLTSCPV